ncbi:hypothetical protein [Halomonas organivorans]|uniref:Sulfotransferase family protein n=1 Tax=Halomonas organivorans TaxID=257772 RepID=A0A7W5C1G8_9GAMM|nr:hypothetical protein [Halomonas organivorans]MBB3142613.1 hypothetical protein [Halomonas organivorans]
MAIISFEKKFIFLKTRKVAGTSVEAVLRNYVGDDDIVPAVTPRDELYSAANGCYSKNYLLDRSKESVYTGLVLDGRFEDATKFLSLEKKLASSHMTYERIEKILSSRGLDIADFYTFTIDRHPYSWVLSNCLYDNKKYNVHGEKLLEVDEGLVNEKARKFLSRSDVRSLINWSMYTRDDVVMVDRVAKYENINRDLAEILSEVGLGGSKVELPDMKNNARHFNAFEILDDDVKDQVYDIFKGAFKTLGYER